MTLTASPFLRPMIAWPTGDSLEILSSCGIGLGRADDLVDVLAAVGVARASTLLPRVTLSFFVGRVDDRGVREDLRDLDDAALDPRLLVLGVVVLGVLGDVAELLGFLDALADLAAADRLEVTELLFELDLAFWGECDLFVHAMTPVSIDRETKAVSRSSRRGLPRMTRRAARQNVHESIYERAALARWENDHPACRHRASEDP